MTKSDLDMSIWSIRQKEFLNLPNLLSLYRIFSFPVVLYFILITAQTVFIVLMMINLLTDILDGYFARRFNCETNLGAKLDSLADEGMYILGLTGIWILKNTELEPYKTGLIIFASAYLLTLIVSLVKYRRLPGLHLYLSKTGGYLQGIFLTVLFLFGLSPFLLIAAMITGIVSFLEQIIVMLITSQMKADYKGLYWVLKNR